LVTNNTNQFLFGSASVSPSFGTNIIGIGNLSSLSIANGSIVISSQPLPVGTLTNSFYVNPIRNSGSGTTGVMVYNSSTKEVTYSGGKTFVIQHPQYNNKFLVHGCLEGPEVGIYYRGEGEITNNKSVTIELPNYVKYIGYNFTIQITKIYEEDNPYNINYQASRVIDGCFSVYGSNGKFYWLVNAERKPLVVEPDKNDYELYGNGPYTYLKKK
jgi:hypothetical protein